MSVAPIHAFVGPNGGGKTLAAVEMGAIPAWKAGKVVVANFRVRVPGFKRLRSWRELVRLGDQRVQDRDDPWYLQSYRLGSHGQRVHPSDAVGDEPIYSLTDNRPVLLMLDEITAALPARSYASTPAQLQRVLNQLRKAKVTLLWTAPNWARAEVIIRECTQAVTVCTGSFADGWERDYVDGPRVFPKRLVDEVGVPVPVEDRTWAPHRLFRWVTYDAGDFDEFTVDESRRIVPIGRRRYWRPRHRAHLLYDTSEQVSLLDHIDDLGHCVICNGTRPRHKCTCPPAETNSRMEAGGVPTGRRPEAAAVNGHTR